MDKKMDRFMGLDNTGDPLTLPLGHLATADNIDITDAGKITRRKGYDLAIAGNVTGAYGTLDHQRMFYVIDGNLTVMDGAVVIAEGLEAERMHWAELNEHVYYSNGTDLGIIDAINSQDFAVVRAMVFLGSLLYIIGLILTDISYTLVDPRIRLE